MKKLFLPIVLMICFSPLTMQAQFGDLLNKAKKVLEKPGEELDISGGLKEALESGVNEAVTSLSTKDGYYASPYKVLIPDEAQKIISTVKKVPGFGNVEEDLIKKMNEAAEIAAKEATPIFVDAIRGMSFDDAKNILFGEENAATDYLEGQSRKSLYSKFLPVIQKSLDEVNAREYWNSVVSQYNKVPFVKKMNPALDDHVNEKALDGLFSLIEVKEKKIRTDIDQRTSPLLKDVFGQLDN
ncbi:MAG: DUF4197 domain-containing protein [Saprospiraceae bacterium]|nr:DUF4197 domain-containing protein [Bacteroidia bacterium]NNF20767.1 DUF4197 domain-containing protein [Saprospiraceae bacterium]